jgi:hypothetical protein
MRPSSVDEAVRILEGVLGEDACQQIARTREEELVGLHFSVGRIIRNEFGLWADNHDLLSATGATNADDASLVILQALHRHLTQRNEPKLH